MMDYTADELEQVVYGGAFFGSGGGGGLDSGLEIVRRLREAYPDLSVEVIDSPGDRTVSVVAGIGSPNSLVGDKIDAFINAVGQAYSGNRTECLIPGEVGAVNSLAPFLAAAKMSESGQSVPVVNGDGAGRAVPKVSLVSFNLDGSTPRIDLTNGDDIDLSITADQDVNDVDGLIRGILSDKTYFGDIAGLSTWNMTGDVAASTYIPGTLDKLRAFGAQVMSNHLEPWQVITLAGSLGWTVDSYVQGTLGVGPTVTAGGFDRGSLVIETVSRTYTLFTQNEAMLSWDSVAGDGVAAPVSICFWDKETARPFTNVEAPKYVGKEVAVYFIKPWQKYADSYCVRKDGYPEFMRNFGYAGSLV